MISINSIWVSQRNLKRASQISSMVEGLRNSIVLPPILLGRTAENSLRVEDGHHRLAAYWIFGRKLVYNTEYVIVETDWEKPVFGKIDWLLDINKVCCLETGLISKKKLH